MTLKELQAALLARGVRVSIGALWRFFSHRRITLKKRRACAPPEQERADVAIARKLWRELMHHLDPRRLICLDESGAVTLSLEIRYGARLGAAGPRLPPL